MSNSNNTVSYFELRYVGKKIPGKFFFNILAFLMVAMFFMLFIWGVGEASQSIVALETPMSLDYLHLFEYSMRTVLRMFCAIIGSLIFTLVYASFAAKNKYCEQILIPLLDILQSVPILGYISFTVTAFLSLFPGSIMGAEMAAIFAIFTSQVWNMTFSLYESLKSVPKELDEVANILGMSGWQKFWRLELPYSIPPLIWNMVLSMSGGWFFVVACEVITVGDNHLALPGIGSYISLALEQKNFMAIMYGIIAMSLVILIYDQILMRPLVVWSDKFRYEMTASQNSPKSWVLSLFYKSTITRFVSIPFCTLCKFLISLPIFNKRSDVPARKHHAKILALWRISHYAWYALLAALGIFASYQLYNYFNGNLEWSEMVYVFKLTLVTLLRVVVLLIIASVIWVPVGVYIGLNPKWTAIAGPAIQFLAAFPVNLFFPLAVIVISRFDLNPNIWLSLLMIFGTQWFILFNVIAGVAQCPNELKEATKNLNIKGWIWWKKIMLPAIMPWYLIGVITACGSAWNTSILAEAVSYGDTKIVAYGIGNYIAENTIKADFHKIVLGIAMMSLFVVTINRFFWKPLHHFINNKYNLN